MSDYNLILDTDSYKSSHFLQYPPGTSSLFAYFENRGGSYGQVMFFGLQYILKHYFGQVVTKEMVEEAEQFFLEHGEPFPKEGWMHIVHHWGGRLPVRIRAVPEGMMVPNSNVMFTVESVDPAVPWIVSWVETMLVRVWYPCNVATKSREIKRVIKKYLDMTCDPLVQTGLDFKLHDFGARGVSSLESAGIGGAAHLVNFRGSDNVAGILLANKYYGCKMAGNSIPAAEHSTIITWGQDREEDAYRNMIVQFAKPGATVAVVSDSYDLDNAVRNLWGHKLRQEVIDSGATVVIRPDSGDPPGIVLNVLGMLEESFGYVINPKGYRVLNHVRVIQGDGIDDEASVGAILEKAVQAGFSAENVGFGMGGGLLQKTHRDVNFSAYKVSSATIDDQMIDVKKDPKTDPRKASKAGRLDLVHRDGMLQTVPLFGGEVSSSDSVMHTVFSHGHFTIDQELQDIRRVADANSDRL